MTRVYYKDAHGCVIMFDLTNRNSFINTLKWKRDVDSKCSLADGSPIPCMLLANKCDMQHRQVDQTEIHEFYKDYNFVGWTETSAKEGTMVNDSMTFLVDVMMQQDVTEAAAFLSDSLKLAGPRPYTHSHSNCSC
jgi:Ras-related protein Rab-7L1